MRSPCGYAKFTGKIGVCLATSGPGAIHLLNGLYDAKLDGQPVLALTGMPYHDLIGTHTQQDVETDRLFADVARYSARIMGPTHVENVADLAFACRTALAHSTVAHIGFPVDLQDTPVDKKGSKRMFPTILRTSPPGVPTSRPPTTCSVPPRSSRPGSAWRSLPVEEPCTPRRSWSRSPSGWAPPSSRRCWAKRPSPMTAHTPPAPPACWGRGPPRRRWNAATHSFWSAPRRGAGSSRSRARRSGGRSVRAAHAAESHQAAGGQLRQIADPRRAEPAEDRPDRTLRQSPGTGLRGL